MGRAKMFKDKNRPLLKDISTQLQACEDQLRAIQHVARVSNDHGSIALLATLTQDGRTGDPKSLGRHRSQVYSQFCEDGHIAEIFHRIGDGGRTFLEIGCGDGVENTTRLLLETGWTGTWVEGDLENCEKARENFEDYLSEGSLTLIEAFVTAENINALLDAQNVPHAVDFLSVDVDQNTSHIWRALNRISRAACIEYNASLPPTVAVEVPYDPSGCWDGSSFFGASLKMMEKIGTEKGVSLVGCDFSGVNAYFVANEDLQDRFSAPFTAEHHYEIAKYGFMPQVGHPRSTRSRRWVRSD